MAMHLMITPRGTNGGKAVDKGWATIRPNNNVQQKNYNNLLLSTQDRTAQPSPQNKTNQNAGFMTHPLPTHTQ